MLNINLFLSFLYLTELRIQELHLGATICYNKEQADLCFETELRCPKTQKHGLDTYFPFHFPFHSHPKKGKDIANAKRL